MAGFPRPILHGLCTYGTVCRAVTDSFLDGDVDLIETFAAKFAGVVFPGETLRIKVWEHDSRLLIAAVVADRDDAPALGNVVLTRR
jgi:acyl dehydratase